MKFWASLGVLAKTAVITTTVTTVTTTSYIIWKTTVKNTFENVKEVAANTEFAIKVEKKDDGLYGLGYKDSNSDSFWETIGDAVDEASKYTTSEEVIEKIEKELKKDSLSAKTVHLDEESGYIQKFINAEVATNYPNLSYKYDGTGYNFEVTTKELGNILKTYGIKIANEGLFGIIEFEGLKNAKINSQDIADIISLTWSYKEKNYIIKLKSTGFKDKNYNYSIIEFKQDGTDILPKQIAKKHLQGTVNIIRRDANASEADKGKNLEYIPYGDELLPGTFAYMVKNNDPNVMHYFSINEENWDIYVPTYTKVNNDDPTFSTQTVSYKNIASKYSVAFEFLVALMSTSGNPTWAAKVAEMVSQNSKIDFVIQDCLTIETKIVNTQYYKTKYNEQGELLRVDHTSSESSTTTETNTIKAYVREADTWIVNVKQNCIKKESETSSTDTNMTRSGDTVINTTTTINIKTISYNIPYTNTSSSKEKDNIISESMEKFLMLGDSFTVGLKNIDKIEGAIYKAEGGKTSKYWIDNFSTLPSADEINGVCLLIGINGINDSNNISNTKTLIDKLCEKYEGKPIYVQKVFPVGKNRTDISNDTVKQYNDEISAYCNEKDNVRFIDTTSGFVDSEGYLITTDPEYIHIDDYNAWLENIENAITNADSSNSDKTDTTTTETVDNSSRIIVLDPGHGKSSSAMTKEEKTAEGFVQNGNAWGEWRHWKNGEYGVECNNTDCAKTGSSCWYGIEYGDRDTEPTLTLNNALAAKKYLEEMGYTVRMTRTSNEQNPSFTKRASYCFNNGDTSTEPDAELYVCIHSNAGGGSGTAYITAQGNYTQKYIDSNFASNSNKAGELINNKVAEATGLKKNTPIGNMGYLIAFNKNPIPTAYLEIGFYDNASDLAILQSKSDTIGKAIAEGINEYLQSVKPSKNSGNNSGKSTSIINSNENKFLGTWMNKTGKFVEYYNADGTINTDALYDPNGKKISYSTKDASRSYPADGLTSNSKLLFELLQSSQRTQQEEQLMRYLLYVYTEIDYGVTEFDFSVFDLSEFKSRRRGSRIVYDSLTFTDEDLDVLYRITQCERGDGTIQQKEYVVSVILNRVLSSAWPDTVKAVVEQQNPNQFQPTLPGGPYYTAVATEETKQAVHNVIENGDTTNGAFFFMRPSSVGEWLRGPEYKYLFNDENDESSYTSHSFYTKPSLLEELKVYMKGGGGNGDIIESCENVIAMMLPRNGTYALKWGPKGLSSDIKKAYESDSDICCATYVAMVLYDAGLFTAEEINGVGYNSVAGISKLLSAAGWTKVKVSEAEAGDIALWHGGGVLGHVYIYAGDNLVYDQRCCVTSSKGVPPTTKAWSGWAYYSAKSTEVWRAP